MYIYEVGFDTRLFYCGGAYMHQDSCMSVTKILGPVSIPQALSNELSPPKQVLSRETAPWDQLINFFFTHLAPVPLQSENQKMCKDTST